MNQERQKTDAIADAVEMSDNKPEGTTHEIFSFGKKGLVEVGWYRLVYIY